MTDQTYRELKGGKRLRVVPNDGGTAQLTARCRVGRSRAFGVLDRLRFLFVGRLWVVTMNGKEHTSVALSLREPKEVTGNGR